MLLGGVVVAGCATIRPTTGPQWAYFAHSESVPSLKMVVYTADWPACEVNRAKEQTPHPPAAWARLRVNSTACVPVLVGSGSDYWVLVVRGGTIGFTAFDWCKKAEEGFAKMHRAHYYWSTCTAVGLTPREPKR